MTFCSVLAAPDAPSLAGAAVPCVERSLILGGQRSSNRTLIAVVWCPSTTANAPGGPYPACRRVRVDCRQCGRVQRRRGCARAAAGRTRLRAGHAARARRARRAASLLVTMNQPSSASPLRAMPGWTSCFSLTGLAEEEIHHIRRGFITPSSMATRLRRARSGALQTNWIQRDLRWGILGDWPSL